MTTTEMQRFKTWRAEQARAEERRKQSELHRLQAMPALASKLAEAVLDHIEHLEPRVIVKDQLADVLLGVLLRSGLVRDPRFPPPPD